MIIHKNNSQTMEEKTQTTKPYMCQPIWKVLYDGCKLVLGSREGGRILSESLRNLYRTGIWDRL